MNNILGVQLDRREHDRTDTSLSREPGFRRVRATHGITETGRVRIGAGYNPVPAPQSVKPRRA